MPHRATTRRSSDAGSAAGLAALVSLLVILVAGVVWLADPFALFAHGGSGPPMFSSASRQADSSAAAITSGEQSSQVMQMAQVAGQDATLTAAGAPSAPTASPTSRQWDTSAAASGVISDAALVRRLDQALVGVDGHVSIAVKDLGSGRGAMLDGDRELPAASLYKLPVLFSVFEAGLSMGEELPITEEARSYDSGTLELGVGETLTVAEALERMVTISDNSAAVMLGSRTGSVRVNADIAALGMDATHYSLERMTTSASDMLHFLDLLAHGKLVSASASADMLHLLLRQRVNDRLPRLLPDNVEVAHKTGNLPGTVNDVGIIYGPTSTLAVAALVSDTTDETAAASAIAHLALAAYIYFADQPENTSRPTIPRPPLRPVPPVWREPHPVPTATMTPLPEDLAIAPAVEITPTLTLSRLPAVSLPATPVAIAGPPTARPTAIVAAATPTPAPAQPTATSVGPAPTRTPARAIAVTTVAPAPATPAKR